MLSIRGKHAAGIEPANLARQISGYQHVLIDLGAGDGRFVRHVAETRPDTFAIGIDLCGDNLRKTGRRAPDNALFVIASAYAPPPELHGKATHLTINFPWGDLLTGLLAHDERLLAALDALCRPGARVEVRINAGAITEVGWSLSAASVAVRRALHEAGFAVGAHPRLLDASDLRAFPSTWARRLAFGRDARALYFEGVKVADVRVA
ncbi:MAG TPA: class I SAM-dependent methyltransferase [Chloroflexia bacterium]|nr:class I SAM-dependent methyltransferase [Chloroflexia bacterium]